MSSETRDTLLHGQLQEGLLYELMSAPAVSGAQRYRELCLAARNEEKRLQELKRRQFSKPSTPDKTRAHFQDKKTQGQPNTKPTQPAKSSAFDSSIRCFYCKKLGHISRDCRAQKRESSGRQDQQKEKSAGAKQVHTEPIDDHTEDYAVGDNSSDAMRSLLFSSDSERSDDVRQIRVTDQGSEPRHAKVEVQGVPARGVIDSGADITIIGGGLFKRVAAVAKLKKRDLKKVDRVPRTYNQRPFLLDGLMYLDISFCGTSMKTPVYIKLDAAEPLLL